MTLSKRMRGFGLKFPHEGGGGRHEKILRAEGGVEMMAREI